MSQLRTGLVGVDVATRPTPSTDDDDDGPFPSTLGLGSATGLWDKRGLTTAFDPLLISLLLLSTGFSSLVGDFGGTDSVLDDVGDAPMTAAISAARSLLRTRLRGT